MKALTAKGYHVNYAWGMNTHGQRMGGPMLPDMMRWLWRDHPRVDRRHRHGRTIVQRTEEEIVV